MQNPNFSAFLKTHLLFKHRKLMIGFAMCLLSAGLLHLGLVSVHAWLAKNDLNQAAHQLSADIEELESLAMSSPANIFVTVKTGTNWCLGFDDVAPACNCSLAGDCQVKGKEAVARSHPLIGSNLLASKDNQWQSKGMYYSTQDHGQPGEPLTLALEVGASQIELQVLPSGKVSLCSDTLDDHPECH